ncbi:RelA/SpoT domain-containing protein (plasmid) [Rhodococcoides fascians A25f]|uniref:GTP pyrophosphokinase n=1 Tax=Rhodococcoides fascians TaxID=1828 RepID=UPI00068BF4EA|nr:RelA/SpoT domain-containing protein [Rhodococcus fascians]QII09237.1 RelA/SpoT domain-containing protein [Rhodococcus fascians A25f]
MTIEKDALAKWNLEKPVYQAWGKFIVQSVLSSLKNIDGSSLDNFLKIPPAPRLKADDSYLAKVQKKTAKDQDIETIDDRVGVRFVVLLTEQISEIEDIVRSFGHSVSKDRDYEAERDLKPLEFAYQSVHLVVRPKSDLIYQGVAIPAGTACEVQIRTLLQHAHSELTHDRLYKSKREAPKSLHRSVARSMALIEATDDIFGDVARKLDEAESNVRGVVTKLDEIYRKAVEVEPTATNYNSEFIEDLIELGFEGDGTSVASRVESLIESKPYLAEKIASNRERRPLMYGISGVLYAYLLATESLYDLKELWPLDLSYLQEICLDLGISID